MLSRRRFLLAAPLLTVAGCSRKATPEPLLIGHVAPLTGVDRLAGERERNGILLAVKEANANLQNKERPLNVLHVDSRGKLDQARHEAVRLVTLNKVLAVLGGRDQAVADQLGQAIQAYPDVLLTPAVHAAVGLDGVFSLDVASAFRADCLADFAASLNVKRALIVADPSSAACARVADSFALKWRSADGRTADSRDLSGEKAAQKIADWLTSSRAEVLVFAGKASDLVAAGKLTLPVLFAGEETEWRRLERLSDAPTKLHAATVHVPEKFDAAGQTFLENYRKEFFEPADFDAWRGYELMRVLTHTVRKEKVTAALALREGFIRKDATFPGLTGPFTFKDNRAVRPLYIVQRGATSATKEYPPS